MKKYHVVFLLVITTMVFVAGCGSKGENAGAPMEVDSTSVEAMPEPLPEVPATADSSAGVEAQPETVPTTTPTQGTTASQADLSSPAPPKGTGGNSNAGESNAGSGGSSEPPKEKQK